MPRNGVAQVVGGRCAQTGSFATAIPRLATAATMTVNVDSPPGALLLVLFSALMVGSIHEGAGGGLFSPAGPGPRPPG